MFRRITIATMGILLALISLVAWAVVSAPQTAFASDASFESYIIRVRGGISASDLCAELDSTCATLH